MDTSQLKRLLPFFVIVIAVLLLSSLFTGQPSVKVDSSKYQAIFLSNNDVYFGKLTNLDAAYVSLSDIYYLKKNPQQATEGTPHPPLSLIKLGKEIHGPEDEMRISNEHILFWENLRADSEVVKKIQLEKEQSAKESVKTTPAPSASAPLSPSTEPSSSTTEENASPATQTYP